MKVYYHKIDSGNVGDDINAVMWHMILPALDDLTSAEWLIGAGTIVDERLNSLPGRKIVMGSGFRPGAKRVHLNDDIRFAAVRGLLSAAQCGLAPSVAACDPGFLANRIWPQDRTPSERVGFIPHIYSERYSSISAAAADAGFAVISPTLAPDPFLRELAQCARVYTESLHGAIFAEALRVPWARMRVCSSYYEGGGVADFKWTDAFSVIGLPIAPANRAALIPLKRSWPSVRNHLRPLQALAEKRLIATLLRRRDDTAVFQLADAGRLEERVETLLERVQQLREPIERWPAASVAFSTATTNQQPLRVLAFPKSGENAYVQNFAQGLEGCGAQVDDFSFRRAWLGSYDVLHLHWPDTHLHTHTWWRALGKHARMSLMFVLLRARGTRIVWMMHNLKPHEKDHWLSRTLFPLWFPRLCTGVVALASSGLTSARQLYPALKSKPAIVVPHGHYRNAYGMTPPRSVARRQLGLREDRFTFLYFGNIRRYKNVQLLIQEFRQVAASNVQLVVAGLPMLGMQAEDLRVLADGDERVHLHLEFIPDEMVPIYFGAADKVVLPFQGILNSGSVMLALSLNRSVLAPALGALPEIQAQVGPRWLQVYDGQLTTQLLTQVSSDAVLQEHEAPDLSAFDWDAIAKTTFDFYRLPTGRSARHASSPALRPSSLS